MDVPTNVHFATLDAVEAVDMATADAIERLVEKIDDLRSGQVTFAVEQARQSGKLEAMETQLNGLQRMLADVNALRDQVTTMREQLRSMEAQAWRSWIEKIAAGAFGGGLATVAQYFFR